MSEVDEDTARNLDRGEAHEPDQADDDGADGEERGTEERPVWFEKVEGIRAGLNGAKTLAQIKPHSAAFDNIRVGLPDEVIEELDALVAARRKAVAA